MRRMQGNIVTSSSNICLFPPEKKERQYYYYLDNPLGPLPTRTTHHQDYYQFSVKTLIRTNNCRVGYCPDRQSRIQKNKNIINQNWGGGGGGGCVCCTPAWICHLFRLSIECSMTSCCQTPKWLSDCADLTWISRAVPRTMRARNHHTLQPTLQPN